MYACRPHRRSAVLSCTRMTVLSGSTVPNSFSTARGSRTCMHCIPVPHNHMPTLDWYTPAQLQHRVQSCTRLVAHFFSAECWYSAPPAPCSSCCGTRAGWRPAGRAGSSCDHRTAFRPICIGSSTEFSCNYSGCFHLQRVHTTRLCTPGVFSTAVRMVPDSGRGPSLGTSAQYAARHATLRAPPYGIILHQLAMRHLSEAAQQVHKD